MVVLIELTVSCRYMLYHVEATFSVDVKNVFYVFLFSKCFFLFLKHIGKVPSGKQINKKHFQNNSNEIQWVHK